MHWHSDWQSSQCQLAFVGILKTETIKNKTSNVAFSCVAGNSIVPIPGMKCILITKKLQYIIILNRCKNLFSIYLSIPSGLWAWTYVITMDMVGHHCRGSWPWLLSQTWSPSTYKASCLTPDLSCCRHIQRPGFLAGLFTIACPPRFTLFRCRESLPCQPPGAGLQPLWNTPHQLPLTELSPKAPSKLNCAHSTTCALLRMVLQNILELLVTCHIILPPHSTPFLKHLFVPYMAQYLLLLICH